MKRAKSHMELSRDYMEAGDVVFYQKLLHKVHQMCWHIIMVKKPVHFSKKHGRFFYIM